MIKLSIQRILERKENHKLKIKIYFEWILWMISSDDQAVLRV